MNAIPGGAGIGQPLPRVDGKLKVTGAARYCAEFQMPGMVHAALVQGTIPAGRITGFDLARARSVPGVIQIVTHQNAPRLSLDHAAQQTVIAPLLQNDRVYYNGQNIAVVVAETLEAAEQAAFLVRAAYAPAKATPIMPERFEGEVFKGAASPHDFQNGRTEADTSRGTPAESFAAAPSRIDAVYVTPNEYHNPMEPHATIAAWDGDRLTVWTTTQGIGGAHKTMASMFDLADDQVRVICPYVGGGFGCKGNTWPPAVLAAMAARMVRRPVNLTLSRKDMYTSNGYRPQTVQHLRLGAAPDGGLQAILHDGVSQMSDPELGSFAEPVAVATRMMYACANLSTSHRVFQVNAGLPTYMRAPGESSGMFALESAMDELAVELGMDPIALRLRNHAARDGQSGKPFSSKKLMECYARGAEMFGWRNRGAAPRSMRDRGMLVGYGMASSTYPGNRLPASAKVRLAADGEVIVGAATQDLGTGTYTVMTQVVVHELGVPADRVTALLGDSDLPPAPVSGGSMTVASITPAIQQACAKLRRHLFHMAAADAGAAGNPDAYTLRDGVVHMPGGQIEVAALLRRARLPFIEATGHTDRGDGAEKYAIHSFGAQFAEVRVDPDLGEIRLARYVGVFDGGRIINPRTAHSQMIGGITYGIGMALTERAEIDPNTGRVVNANLAEYLVPVNPDVPEIEVAFIGDVDPAIDPLGARGLGELPMVGVAPAIANAVFHATGVRVRRLPIRIEDVLA